MPQTILRTLSIYDKGSYYTIEATDDKTHLYTIYFNSRSAPHMTIIRASDINSIVGSATYQETKKFGISTASNITLKIPSSTVSLNKEGGFFGNDKRTMRSAVLGHVYWSSRQVNNPWKGGRSETSFMRLADARGKTLVEYKDEGHTLKEMGVMEIGAELTQEALDEVVVSGMAMLSEEQTGVRATRSCTMPKEHRKRGRREEKKRRREEGEDQAAVSKRQKLDDAEEEVEIIVDDGGGAGPQKDFSEYAPQPGDMPFYGLLGEDEQEYFKKADSMLELNQFADQEERNLFLGNVYKEARGKELKIANSQSCSRLMERLILLSTPDQLKNLFQKFSGHFLHLVQHRFASHCCEALFLQAAPIVNQELTAPLDEEKQNRDDGDVFVSMENLFLYTLNELEGNLGYLMSDQFASHPLRILLVVLSGMPLATASSSSVLQSKKKEHVSITGGKAVLTEEKLEVRMVPDSFHTALEKMMAGTVAGLDTTFLRVLATHPIANPVLQLLLELELTRSAKQSAKDSKSLFRKLVPDDALEEGTENASFINNLVYDTIGSRLLEVIIFNAPGKTFKALYQNSFKNKIGTFAKNEVAAFVVIKIIERLNKEDLMTALDEVCPQIDTLIKRSRTSVVKTLIERCRVRQLDASSILSGLKQAYGEGPSERLIKMLKVSSEPTDGMAEDRRKQLDSRDSAKIHGSLLAQCMLEAPGELRELICDGLLAMEMPFLITIAKDRTASRVLQTALVCPEQTPKFRRLLIPHFYNHIEDFSMDPIASHVVDSIWEATTSLTFIRERIANELAKHESALRASISGRAVWRNWKMDLYKRRRKEWLDEAKGQRGDENKAVKTGIELARERFATGTRKQQHKALRSRTGNDTGVNSILQGTAAIQGKA